MKGLPIVVGVNGSEESVRAASLAALAAQRLKAELAPVYAAPDYSSLVGLGIPGVEVVPLDTTEADRAAIAASLHGYVPQQAIDALVIRTGRAALVLEQVARERGAGLIAVGSRYRRGMNRVGRDTIRHLVRTCDVPLLVADGGGPDIKRVLAAVDLSWATRPTIEAAAAWATTFGATLRIMFACEPLPEDMLPGHARLMETHDCERRAFELMVEPWAGRGTEVVMRQGRAGPTIAREAARWRADLLVVGSHGRGFVDRLLIGSTTERLLRRPPAPTLVLPLSRRAEHRLEIESLPWEESEVAGVR